MLTPFEQIMIEQAGSGPKGSVVQITTRQCKKTWGQAINDRHSRRDMV